MKIKLLLIIFITICMTLMFPVDQISGSSSRIKLQTTLIGKYDSTFKSYEPIIEIEKKGFNPGEKIKISYSGAPIYNNAWIGLFKVDYSSDKLIGKSLIHESAGVFEITAPSEVGQYIVRIFEDSDQNSAVGMPKELYITTYSNIQLKVDKQKLNPCEEITIKYSGLPNDVPATINIGEFSRSLWYKTEGEIKVMAPSIKGTYNARIFINGKPNLVIYDKELISVSKTLADKTLEDPLNVITRLYFTNFANFSLARTGKNVRGYYDHNNGYIEGTVESIDSGYKITGIFKEISEKTGKKYTGDIILYISSDAEIVQGSWKLSGYSIWEPLSGGWPNGDVYGLRNIRINSGVDKLCLLWDEDFQEGIAGYNVYRRNSSGAWDSKPLNDKPLSEIQYVDTKVQHGQKYSYLIKGVFKNGVEKNISAETSVYCGKAISINFKNYSLWIQTSAPQMDLTNYYPYTQIEDNYVVVPLRFYSELVGCTINWDASNNEAVISKNGTIIKIKPNNSIMKINGKSVRLPYPPSYKGASLYVPLRAVFSELGCNIKWDVKTQTADIVF